MTGSAGGAAPPSPGPTACRPECWCWRRLGDLLADGIDRIERGHRILQDHRDLAAADIAHLRSLNLAGPRPRTGSCRRRSCRRSGPGRSRDRLVIVLPQPDSPTMPNVSPGATEKLTPSTALTTPRRGIEIRAQVLHLQQRRLGGHLTDCLSRGSSRSRSQSPEVAREHDQANASPGKNEIHHAVSIRLRPSETIEPQVAMGGGNRRRVAERRFSRMTPPMNNVARISVGLTIFGKMWAA